VIHCVIHSSRELFRMSILSFKYAGNDYHSVTQESGSSTVFVIKYTPLQYDNMQSISLPLLMIMSIQCFVIKR
jgi:hypothetical protein